MERNMKKNNAIEAMLQRYDPKNHQERENTTKSDVSNLIFDKAGLNLWKKELFLATLDELKSEGRFG